jgi:hypothetical protein
MIGNPKIVDTRFDIDVMHRILENFMLFMVLAITRLSIIITGISNRMSIGSITTIIGMPKFAKAGD